MSIFAKARTKGGKDKDLPTYDPLERAEGQEKRRQSLMTDILQEQSGQASGGQRFVEGHRRLALEGIARQAQVGGAYSASAGIAPLPGGQASGAPFAGGDQLALLRASHTGIMDWMNNITGPVARQLAFSDKEALDSFWTEIDKQSKIPGWQWG